MKLYNKTSIIIVALIVLFFLINTLVSYKIALKEEIISAYQKDKLILKNLFLAQEKYLSVVAELFASDSIVLEAYKSNNPLLLQKHINPMWKKLKNEKLLYEVHFFLPPAISFVNFSNFKSFGRDVSKVRTDILKITSSLQKSAHVLMCKTYAGYRVTESIVDENGTILGGLSIGKKLDWIPNVIKERTSHDSFLVYYRDATVTLTPHYKRNFLINKKAFREFLLADKTIMISTKELKNINFNNAIQDVYIKGKKYTLFSYPVLDFNKHIMGYLCTVTQLEEFNERFLHFSIQEIIMIVLSIMVLFFMYRRYANKIVDYIENIKELTTKVKEREFKFLHNRTNFKDVPIDALMQVEENIIDMGIVIEERYSILENDNREKALELIKQLYMDELTGIGNRSALERDLVFYKKSYMALINIQNFESINDAFGYEAGDYILKEVTTFYQDKLDENFMLYRIGADKFAVLNKEGVSKEKFISTIINILKTLHYKLFYYKTIEINITAYAGLVLEENRRLSKANITMRYANKHRLEYAIYDEKKDTQIVQANNIAMVSKLTDALTKDKIVPYFQAIVDRDKNIVKYEALVRMLDTERVLSPFHFLELSKRTSMYYDITKLMIEKTFYAFKDSKKLFSINITAKDIFNEEIVALIYEKIKSHPNPKQIVFELVESDDLYNITEIEIFLSKIRQMGAKIAIDDFGTGYSNFTYIINLKPDYLKIDGSLIKDMDTDHLAYKTVETIVNFSHDVGICVVAEFVHSETIYNLCLELNVDEFQGYYFAEPESKIML